jgi:hypothetical protein
MMRRTSLGRTALVFLYGGVAPLEPVKSPCEKAAFQAAPATEREWLAVTFDVEDLRVHRRGDKMWIEVHDAKWGADGLWAVSRPRWKSGRAIVADSLTIPWGDIELIEKPTGRRTGIGAGVGAFAGLGVGLGIAFAAEYDCHGEYGCGPGYLILPMFTVPAGAVIGAIAGSTAHSWVPFFCASSPSRSSSTRPAEPRE